MRSLPADILQTVFKTLFKNVSIVKLALHEKIFSCNAIGINALRQKAVKASIKRKWRRKSAIGNNGLFAKSENVVLKNFKTHLSS